jgi:hypothetical protein
MAEGNRSSEGYAFELERPGATGHAALHGSFLDPSDGGTLRRPMHLHAETSEGEAPVVDIENNFMINQNGQGS